jgi:hypothetical protein
MRGELRLLPHPSRAALNCRSEAGYTGSSVAEGGTSGQNGHSSNHVQ